MFDIGFGELLLIAVLALVVLGPERLPKAARTLGTLLRRVRSGWESVRAEVEREIEAEELKQKLKEAQEYMRQAGQEVGEQVRKSADSVRQAAQPKDTTSGSELDEDLFDKDLFGDTAEPKPKPMPEPEPKPEPKPGAESGPEAGKNPAGGRA